jgi:hypothetical protein
VQVTHGSLQQLLAFGLVRVDTRVLLLPVVKRLLRCSPTDVKVKIHYRLMNNVIHSQELTYELFPSAPSVKSSSGADKSSDILGDNIILSEMFYILNTTLPSYEELLQITGNSYIMLIISLILLIDLMLFVLFLII